MTPPDTPPAPTASGNPCGPQTLTRSGSPPSGVTWYWQGLSCDERTDLGSGTTFTATESGTYYIRARSDAGCWSDACGQVTVTVNDTAGAPPAPTASGNPCGPQTLTRSGSPPSGVTWYWQGLSCDERTDLGSGTTFTATESGTYYIRARSDAGCWSDSCGQVGRYGQ